MLLIYCNIIQYNFQKSNITEIIKKSREGAQINGEMGGCEARMR
jgi:hypothetical protein